MLKFWPARPTWRAESMIKALIQLGYNQQQAEGVLAAAAVDQSDRCLFLYRNDQFDRCDVVMVNTNPSESDGTDAVLVLECHLDMVANSFDEAVANWPYNGSLHIVAGNVTEGRPS